MSYFISPPEQTIWQMDALAFVDALRQRWWQADVRSNINPTSNVAMTWTLFMHDRRLDGTLDRSGQAVYVDGDIEDCAQFALWVRTQVPAEQPLVFYDEGYSADVPLEADTTVSELVTPFAG